MEYQISPLEYANGEDDKRIMYPHDNAPEFKQVYMWECQELTDEETLLYEDTVKITWNYCYDDNAKRKNKTKVTYIVKDAPLRRLPPAEQTYYDFMGWYTEGGKRISETTIPESNEVTYYAQWRSNIQYNVTFVLNDGSSNVVTVKKRKGEQITNDDIPIFERIGYHQSGWVGEVDPNGYTVT